MKINRKHAKGLLISFFAVLMPLLANAETVEIEGIWYNLITKVKQAEVTYQGNNFDEFSNEYTGAITIPATVIYDSVTYSVTSIRDYTFYECYGLTGITLPEGLKRIGEHAFWGCSNLTTINIPASVTSIGNSSFYLCNNLTTVYINDIAAWCKTDLGDSSSNPFSYANNLYVDGELVTELTLPKGVTSIRDYAFSDCNSLTAITIPEGVTSIGICAFDNCSSLTTINIPASLKSIETCAFRDCRNLTSITLPEDVVSIGGQAFSGCSSLTTINIPASLKSIEYYAFAYCSSLTAITIHESVTNVGSHAFDGCSNLTAIVLPKTLESIDYKAFVDCAEILDVYCYADNIPSTETNAFDGSYLEYATLHVPTSALESYKEKVPWSSFGNIVALGAAITRITLDKTSATLTEGETLSLTTTITPDDADTNLISWTSSNSSIAIVTNDGKVTAVAPGTATITAMANDCSGVSASCEVTVLPAKYILTAYIDREVFATDTLTRGEFFNLIEPQKEGYTFSGWGDVPDRMPNHDLNIYATFIINKYLVTFKIGDVVVAADSLEYKSAIVVPEAPEKEGYTFNGWGEVAATVPTNDLTYEGSYTINTYTLTYTVDGVVVLHYPVVYGGAIPRLLEPSKPGYTFSGWSEMPETMPAKDVTIVGSFTELASIFITINQADNGCVKQKIAEGTSCTFVIEASEGWMINAVTFNGEDVTSLFGEGNIFVTPEMYENAVLNISYEKIDDSVESIQTNAAKVRGHNGIISISEVSEGETITIYTLDGVMVANATATTEITTIEVPTQQVYIVKVADKVVKIGM